MENEKSKPAPTPSTGSEGADPGGMDLEGGGAAVVLVDQPGPVPEEPAKEPTPPNDIGTWRIRRGAIDCYFIDSNDRERIVGAKRREDLEYIIHAVKAMEGKTHG